MYPKNICILYHSEFKSRVPYIGYMVNCCDMLTIRTLIVKIV